MCCNESVSHHSHTSLCFGLSCAKDGGQDKPWRILISCLIQACDGFGLADAGWGSSPDAAALQAFILR